MVLLHEEVFIFEGGGGGGGCPIVGRKAIDIEEGPRQLVAINAQTPPRVYTAHEADGSK